MLFKWWSKYACMVVQRWHTLFDDCCILTIADTVISYAMSIYKVEVNHLGISLFLRKLSRLRKLVSVSIAVRHFREIYYYSLAVCNHWTGLLD